jgi:hypothetical protein
MALLFKRFFHMILSDVCGFFGRWSSGFSAFHAALSAQFKVFSFIFRTDGFSGFLTYFARFFTSLFFAKA